MQQGQARPEDEPSEAVDDGGIRAVRRVAAILDLFTHGELKLTVGQAATLGGLNRSTLHRYFNSMSEVGLLERVEENSPYYVPGPLLVGAGAAAMHARRVTVIAPPFLRDLSNRLSLTVVLSVWTPRGPVVTLVAEDYARPLMVTVRAGTVLRLDSAQGLIFASGYGFDHRIEGALATDATQDPARVAELVADGMPGGLSIVTQPDGLRVIGAGIFDERGLCAAIGVVGTTSTLALDEGTEVQDAVSDAASRLSQAMGGSGVAGG